MKIEVSAGEFELVAYTDGHPHWVTLKSTTHRDQEISGIHHSNLSDLEYAVKRMREKLKAHGSRPEEI